MFALSLVCKELRDCLCPAKNTMFVDDESKISLNVEAVVL